MLRKLSHSIETFDYSTVQMELEWITGIIDAPGVVEIHSGYKVTHKLKLIGTVIHFNAPTQPQQ